MLAGIAKDLFCVQKDASLYLITPRAELQVGGEQQGELLFNGRDSGTRLSFQAGQRWTVPLSSSIRQFGVTHRGADKELKTGIEILALLGMDTVTT